MMPSTAEATPVSGRAQCPSQTSLRATPVRRAPGRRQPARADPPDASATSGTSTRSLGARMNVSHIMSGSC
jgi:hypothetical protein